MDIWIELGKMLLPGIIVGIFMAKWNRQQDKRQAEAAEEAAAHIKSELLRTDLLVATASLSYAVAMAIKRGTPNGEIEEGIKHYDRAMDRFRKFEREQLVKNTLD